MHRRDILPEGLDGVVGKVGGNGYGLVSELYPYRTFPRMNLKPSNIFESWVRKKQKGKKQKKGNRMWPSKKKAGRTG